MAADDYYEVLGVSKTATVEEIQKAYRKLARKYHPDLHTDESDREKEKAKQNFQKVQQAYDVLSDEKKRQMYDQMGPGFEQMGGGGQPFPGGQGNPFGGMDIDLSSLFGGGGGRGAPGGGGAGFEQIFRQMGGGGPQQRTQAPAKPEPVEQEITVPFATSVLGGDHQVSFKRTTGKVETISVKIPAGIESGKKIRLRGQGAESYSGQRGDMMIVVKVAPHPNYGRKGLNLLLTVPITLAEAALGAKVDVPTPHGTVTLTVPAGTSSGKSLRLKGMGVRTKDKKGDLIAELQIQLPEKLTEDDEKLIRQLELAYEDKNPRSDIRW
ncbi:DnaJ C-terminal domain-containing protein [Mariniblastus fucicola]|uniref:Curved DNA-binding protein n=1 Tax=Mariniblastus fucicola TaxID=980251 RepID=A0A5B9PFM5_9BACT|nr:DnaJ C-terminal domain-containing protein [Mariniblastus fucicola]QEG21751.1 Curved DNA-binding protein [Mariniblastus fucicola]